MSRITIGLLVVLFLAGCDENFNQVAFEQGFDASVACVERASVLQGFGHFDPNGRYEEPEDPSADGADASNPEGLPEDIEGKPFRTLAGGGFVAEFTRIPMRPPWKAYSLTCTGNTKTTSISSIQIDGRLYRPPAGETWTYKEHRWDDE